MGIVNSVMWNVNSDLSFVTDAISCAEIACGHVSGWVGSDKKGVEKSGV